MPVTSGIISVRRGQEYLALAQSGTVLRAFRYGAAGQHLETLGVIDTTPKTVQLAHIHLLSLSDSLLWFGYDAAASGYVYGNWKAALSTFTTKDVEPEDNVRPGGCYWRASALAGSIWFLNFGTESHEWRRLTSESDGHTLHDWNPGAQGEAPDTWRSGSIDLASGVYVNAIPTAGAIWSQAVIPGSGVGASNRFTYFRDGGAATPSPHTGTVSALNSDQGSYLLTAQKYLTPGAQTHHGGIAVLTRVSSGFDVVAHLASFATVRATGTLTQVALTPSSWGLTSSAGQGLQVTPDGSEFVWYDPAAKKFVRYSTNPANAITEGDSLAARQIAVEDAPGGHAIKMLIPLN